MTTVVDQPRPAGTPDEDEFISVTGKRQRKGKPNAIIGTRKNNELKVIGGRHLCVFLSRLDASVTVDEVIACVKNVHNGEAKCDTTGIHPLKLMCCLKMALNS